MKPANSLVLVSLSLVLYIQAVTAQTTQFSYQGNLTSGGVPANGNHDLEFLLFDALSGGTQLGSTQTITGVVVTNGSFSVSLDFGNQFPGAERYLEIRVRLAGGGSYSTLSPRQKIASQPYAVKSLSADTAATATNATNATNAANATTAATATNALQLGGFAASQYVLTGDVRLSDARSPLPGSANYIQNQNAVPQASSNFNISGTGTANIFDVRSRYTILGDRFASSTLLNTTYLGRGAGEGGGSNSFFGFQTGAVSTGGSNSFFGTAAGAANTTGSFNSFFGTDIGASNITGSRNTLVGYGSNVGASNLANAAAIGANAVVTQSNSLVLGSINGQNGATADTNVGIGTTAPSQRLHVVGNGLFTGNLLVSGSFTGSVGAGNVTGVLGVSNGGTGLSTPGSPGFFLKSVGPSWTSSPIQAGDIPAGSLNYIQNQSAAPQTSANFNISGGGTFGGTVTIPAGAGNVPSLTFAGDTDTGMFRNGTNTIGFTAGATVAMQLSPTGITIPETTRYLSLNAGAFSPTSSTTQWSSPVSAGYGLSGVGNGQIVAFQAPVNLPHGASIISFQVTFVDNSLAQNMNFMLFFTQHGAGGLGNIGSVATSGNSGSVQTITVPTPELVDNVIRAYGIRATWTVPPAPEVLQLISVLITYTVTRPLP